MFFPYVVGPVILFPKNEIFWIYLLNEFNFSFVCFDVIVRLVINFVHILNADSDGWICLFQMLVKYAIPIVDFFYLLFCILYFVIDDNQWYKIWTLTLTNGLNNVLIIALSVVVHKTNLLLFAIIIMIRIFSEIWCLFFIN